MYSVLNCVVSRAVNDVGYFTFSRLLAMPIRVLGLVGDFGVGLLIAIALGYNANDLFYP